MTYFRIGPTRQIKHQNAEGKGLPGDKTAEMQKTMENPFFSTYKHGRKYHRMNLLNIGPGGKKRVTGRCIIGITNEKAER